MSWGASLYILQLELSTNMFSREVFVTTDVQETGEVVEQYHVFSLRRYSHSIGLDLSVPHLPHARCVPIENRYNWGLNVTIVFCNFFAVVLVK